MRPAASKRTTTDPFDVLLCAVRFTRCMNLHKKTHAACPRGDVCMISVGDDMPVTSSPSACVRGHGVCVVPVTAMRVCDTRGGCSCDPQCHQRSLCFLHTQDRSYVTTVCMDCVVVEMGSTQQHQGMQCAQPDASDGRQVHPQRVLPALPHCGPQLRV